MSRGRFFIALLLFANVFINFADRVNLSVAAPEIARAFDWDPARMGWLFSAYLWTYTVLLIPGGWLVDRLGPRLVSAVSIAVWSSAAMLTGAVSTLGQALAARFGLGVGEAAAMPACNKVVRQCFPAEERGFVTAIFHSGVFVSAAVGAPVVAWLVIHTSWRWSFVIIGSSGFVWLVAWLLWFRQPAIARDSNETPALPFAAVAATLMKQRSTWGIALTEGCINYMNYMFLAWLPSYLVQDRGMNLMRAGLFSAIPYATGIVLELSFGHLSDRLLIRQRSKAAGRRRHVILFLLLSTVVLVINFVHSEWAIITVVSLALSFNATAVTFMYSLTNDLVEDPEVAGAAFGFMLLGGNIFGMAAPIITGYLVKAAGNFSAAFVVAGVLPLIGVALAWLLIRKPIQGTRA